MRIKRSALIVFAASSFVGLHLAGCGSGSGPDSAYKGSYRSVYSIPSLGESGSFTFSIEQKGHMTGSLLDSNTNKSYPFDGSIGSNGSFSGNVKDGANQYKLSGTFSPGSSGTGGIAGGDFKETRSETDYRGSFSLTTDTVPVNTVNSFRGAYSGSYSVPGLNQTGVVSFSVNSQGLITGSLTRGTETGFFSGSVQESGNFSGTAQFASGAVGLSGTLNKTTDGSTSGNFQLSQNGQSFPGAFGPTTSAPAGDSPYLGSYRGTYAVPENGESGNVSFSVDPRGNLTGFFSQQNNSPVGTFVGAFNNDGQFTGTITYDPGTGVPKRTITGKLGKSAVSDKLAGDFIFTVDGSTRGIPGNFEVAVGASEADSNYRATYQDSGRFPGTAFIANGIPNGVLTTSSVNTFNIDKQGVIIGTLGSSRIDGRITNDGRTTGVIIGNDGNPYQFRGIMNKVFYDFPDKTLPGIGGNFLVTVNGADYPFSLKSLGGDGTTK